MHDLRESLIIIFRWPSAVGWWYTRWHLEVPLLVIQAELNFHKINY